MSTHLIAVSTFVALASVATIGAHSYGSKPASLVSPVDASFISQTCQERSGPQGTPGPDHHAHLGAVLGLSADQQANIERIAGDACAALTKYHEQILAELTPEQRTKMLSLHRNADGPSAFHRFMIKLHGG